jgi:hypothetical protein
MNDYGDEQIRAQLRRAAEQLYEDPRLRDALDDEQARQLLGWGMQQLQRAARRVVALPAAEAAPELEEQAASLREVIARVNDYVQGYGQWSEAQRREQIAGLVEWLCRGRAADLQIGDVVRLETIAAAGDTLTPQELFSSLLTVITNREEEE